MAVIEMKHPGQRLLCGPLAEALPRVELRAPVLVLGSQRSVEAVDWQPLREFARLAFFTESAPHNPQEVADEACAIARVMAPGTIVAVGSASAIDLGKVVAESAPGAVTVAIPTTLGGAEMTRGYGILQRTLRKQVGVARDVYGTVCYDPALLESASAVVIGSTGINGWAHTIEARYAQRRHWMGRAAADSAGRRFPALLLRASAQRDPALHCDLFAAASLAGFAINTCGMGVHHAVCHALGGITRIPHGVLNALVLPHALALNARKAPQRLAEVAEAFGIPDLAGEARRLRDAFALPRSLAALGVAPETAQRAAAHVLESPVLRNNPAPLDHDDLRLLLQAVYEGDT